MKKIILAAIMSMSFAASATETFICKTAIFNDVIKVQVGKDNDFNGARVDMQKDKKAFEFKFIGKKFRGDSSEKGDLIRVDITDGPVYINDEYGIVPSETSTPDFVIEKGEASVVLTDCE